MDSLKLLVFFALMPALAAGSDSVSNVPVQPEKQKERPAPQTDAGEKSDERRFPHFGSVEDRELPGLREIDSFRMQLMESDMISGGPSDSSMAVLVNPFTIRKRSWYYGSVYLYHRNDNLDARNFFDPVGKPLPEFKRNQFGLTFGAFVTDKLTVSGSYDGTRIIRGSTMLSLVPTRGMKNGDFSSSSIELIDPSTGEQFRDQSGRLNIIPQERIHPVALKMLPLIPDPNRSDPKRNYVNNSPAVSNIDTISTRIDYEFNRQTKLFGNFSLEDGSEINVAPLPEFNTNQTLKDIDVSVNLSHSFNANNVLNLRLSYSRFSSLELSKHAGQAGLLDSLGIEGVSALDDLDEGYPMFNIYGYAPLGSGFSSFFSDGISPNTSFFNNYGIEGDFAHIRGSHNIAFGGQIHFEQSNDTKTWGIRRGDFGFTGQFTRNAFADFLLGIPGSAKRGIGSDRSDLRQRNWRLFFKDDWKVNSNLTVSIGLRYAFSPFPRSIHDNVSFFHPLLFEPPRDGEMIVTGSRRARELGLKLKPGEAAYNDRNDWQPNVGVAYSPFGNNRMVFRFSYSIRHDDVNLFMAGDYIGKNYPFYYIDEAKSTSPDLDLSNPFASGVTSETTVRALDPGLRNPYIQRWEASVQYHFGQNWDMELEYEGQKTTRLHRTIPANVPLPAPLGEPIQPRRPNPDFGAFQILTSGASASSNALIAQLRRRMTGIFSLQAGFEWRQAFSDMTSQPSNPRNLAAERAYYGFNSPLEFNLNYLLDLPIGEGKWLSTKWAGKMGFLLEGWRISGITAIESGRPFTPTIPYDFNNDGVWGDRPNRIGSGRLPDSERSIDQWFKTSDFVMPDVNGTNPQWFGNSGRNILTAPGEQVWDISFLKRTRVTESGSMLEFRVQLFNAFNHVNFEQPGSWFGTETFGVISNADDAREIEIAVKYSF
jgi:hypothetical protein